MSKAFTRESDDAADEPIRRQQSFSLPPGVKNYVTPGGAKKLRDELDRLIQIERPRLLKVSGDARRELQSIDQRIAYLDQSLRSAEIVRPPEDSEKSVRFGATVTVRNRAGELTDYCIVGIDETDLDRNRVSWRSPIARALLNAPIGKRVRFKIPSGEEEMEIIAIRYEE